MKYDYLIVGAGLFGSVFAHEAAKKGKCCLVIDKKNHVGGNVYCENVDGILVHTYGAHIFHTSDKAVWEYVQQFSEFNHYINSPVAVYHEELYNLPFNMNTFHKLWGVRTPSEAKAEIARQVAAEKIRLGDRTPENLEEQALLLVGRDVYEKLVKEYTEKQWGRRCQELPAFIIRRLPLRFTYDNNYFDDPYQGIPVDGYTAIIEKMLAEVDVELGVDFLEQREAYREKAEKIIYTGMIDAYFDYKLGHLQYRTVRFETERLDDTDNYQGNAVVNYTSHDQPYTRIIEHKHFAFGKQDFTVISREYSTEWRPGMEPYYPVNDEQNSRLYEQYKQLAETEPNVIFGGRLGQYRYYNMDQVIKAALELAGTEFGR